MLSSSRTFAIVVPARRGSTRFPAKPLAPLGGQTLIECVLDRLGQFCPLEQLYLATDDEEIASKAKAKAQVVMTPSDLPSGTDRCQYAVREAQIKAELIINAQGDEPFVEEAQLQALLDLFEHPSTQIGTLACPCEPDEVQNPNAVKVVRNAEEFALYFSRSPIPFDRNQSAIQNWRHLGLYAFRSNVLLELAQLSPSPLELAESLEQLRWLENGYSIRVANVLSQGLSIDTPEDLKKAQSQWI
jgi:3-deoxy-manno-octulosonate cytidylyltransferase (CMP-KDO synthetase)